MKHLSLEDSLKYGPGEWPTDIAFIAQAFGDWIGLTLRDGRSFGINTTEVRIVQLPSDDCPLFVFQPLDTDVTPT